MSNKPLILTDNLYENVVLHPSHLLSNRYGVDVSGAEMFRVADNLRDLTGWTMTPLNTQGGLEVDTLVTTFTPDTVIIDHGHNLAGQTVTVAGAADTSFAGQIVGCTCVIPSVAGGLPSDVNGCVTPDGVWWKTFTPIAGKRVFLTLIAAMGVGLAPIVKGLYLGKSYRLSEFLNAPGAYDYGTQVKYMNNQTSRGGVRVKSRPINMDRLAISIDVESTDYQGFENEMRRVLRYNAPMWFAFDDSDVSADARGQMRMFQLAGDTLYDPRVNPVHREIRVEFEEVIPTLYA